MREEMIFLPTLHADFLMPNVWNPFIFIRGGR